MLKIRETTVNYEINPIGITSSPKFGWIISSDKSNVVQESYQIQIAKDQSFKTIIFDTGVVESEASVLVTVKDFTIESSSKYYYRIKISNNYKEESPWSETAYFITALLDNKEFEAKFITAETPEDADNSKGTYVRKDFHVRKDIEEAYVYATALGVYNMYINEVKVGNDELTPGWTSYNKHLLYQTYDITSYLKSGNNAVGAMLGAGWYKGELSVEGNRNHYGKQTAFFCQIIIKYKDGTTEKIITDSSWKGEDSPVIFSEIYDGETYDARKEIENWNKANFDDSNWRSVGIIHHKKEVLRSQEGARIREITKVPAKRIFKTPEGDTVIDFGQNLAGWVEFRARGDRDNKVELNCFEVLDAKGNVYIDNLRGAKQTITYIFKEDEDVVFSPQFTFQGFQYARIISYPGDPKVEDFVAYSVHSNMERLGEFKCSNPDVNQLHQNILWSLKGNFLDIPTDCPQRNERLGWTGDAQIFCRTATYLKNTRTFFKKWLVDLEKDQTDEGGVPHIIPDVFSIYGSEDWLLKKGYHSSAAWADAAIIIPWTLYLAYGDKEILEIQYESMKAWIEFMRKNEKDGMWNYKLQFGDWVALDAEEGSYFGATPTELTGTAYYAYSSKLFSKIAKVLGREDDYRTYLELHNKVKDNYQKIFFNEDGELTSQTQTAHIVSLHFNLVPDPYIDKTIDGLVRLLEKEDGHLVTGFIGTPYFCHVLSNNGHTDKAYDLLLKDDFPSWLYQVKMGATTIWEHWDGMKPDGTMWSADMNSFNHYAYGAIGEWLYKAVAGIDVDENNPGYKHSIIHPHVSHNFEFVEASYKSVYGDIKVNWHINNNEVNLKVIIPHNTKATIVLDGVEYTEEEVGSGEHEFTYKI